MRQTGRRVAAALAALGLLLGLVLVAPERAFACECAGISTRRAFAEADAVFLGTVSAAEEVGRRSARRAELRFAVSRAFKGTVYADQLVASPVDAAACGVRPELGSSWVIFAVGSVEGEADDAVYRLKTTTCSGNLPTASPPAALGRGRSPLPGRSDREEVSENADALVTRVLTTAALGTLGLAALAGVALVVIWRPRTS